MMRHLTLGTAGHVDHGKTTLVRALTGIDTDRLAEEQRRGISIVLGYATLTLGDELELSVVDVPGHERFVRTMVGGATGIDLALICIAADDGVMPQTREHLAILELLGVEHAVVALTKVDLTDEATQHAATAGVRELLATTRFADAPIVPVASQLGSGLDALRVALRSAAATTTGRAADGRVRLPIDRSFVLHGIGTVVTGTLWSGTLAVGDTVSIHPGARSARVRSLEVHDAPVDAAAAGSRVAAALVGVERDEVPPGSVLWTGGTAAAGYRLDVAAHLLADADSLRRGALIEVLHGTTVTQARAITLDGETIASGGDGFVQLRLVQPLAALRGDRLVLRRLAPPGTIAGATVLDPRPPRHAGAAADLVRLRLYASGEPATIAQAALAGGALRASDLVDRGLLDPTEAAAALAPSEHVIALGDWRLRTAGYAAIRSAVEGRLGARRTEHPLDPAVPLGQLLKDSPWREALVDRLVADGVAERAGAGLRSAGSAIDAATAIAEPAVAALAAAPFATHRQADLAEALNVPADDAWALINQLDRSGGIARLPDGLVVHGDAYAEAVRHVRERCGVAGTVTLAELRDATASSRKVAQALLERMDSDGITRRQGDARILRRTAT